MKVSHPSPPNMRPPPPQPVPGMGSGGRFDRTASLQRKTAIAQRVVNKAAGIGPQRAPAQRQGLANTPSIRPAFNKARKP
ncbi:hypothetical protein GCM10023165_28590 [Variovorax defluvii]|uniref:Uncharacterized protein n=1 Tax=Variovorax defluvii TaxID=913761 RepID=A0ABP8HV01_9BURK